jgi:hypothetical protein
VISLDYVQFIEGNQIFWDKRIALPLGETYRDKFFKALDDNMLTGKK